MNSKQFVDHSGFVVAIKLDNEKEQVYLKSYYLGLLEGRAEGAGGHKHLPPECVI